MSKAASWQNDPITGTPAPAPNLQCTTLLPKFYKPEVFPKAPRDWSSKRAIVASPRILWSIYWPIMIIHLLTIHSTAKPRSTVFSVLHIKLFVPSLWSYLSFLYVTSQSLWDENREWRRSGNCSPWCWSWRMDEVSTDYHSQKFSLMLLSAWRTSYLVEMLVLYSSKTSNLFTRLSWLWVSNPRSPRRVHRSGEVRSIFR